MFRFSMMKSSPDFFSPIRLALVLCVAATAGALAGVSATFFVPPRVIVMHAVPPSQATTSAAVDIPTSTPAEPQFIPLDIQLARPILPPEFAVRRSSPVATLYRKPKGTVPEERLLTDDRVLGQAVSLTSDGWFVTTASVLANHPLSDIILWADGQAMTPVRVMTDRINGTTFIKVAASDLTAPAFGRLADIVPGSEVWFERRPSVFSPSFVASVTEGVGTQPLSSEFAARRLSVDSRSVGADIGSPIWNRTGSLVGLIESSSEGTRVIPATSIATSFISLLNDQEIRHALFGVHAIDLARWRIDGDRGGLPLQGAWIPPDRVFGKLPSIIKDSPAAKAGLLIGDVILRIDRDLLDGSADLGERLSEYRPGATVTMHILRDGAEQDISVTLGSFVSSESLK